MEKKSDETVPFYMLPHPRFSSGGKTTVFTPPACSVFIHFLEYLGIYIYKYKKKKATAKPT